MKKVLGCLCLLGILAAMWGCDWEAYQDDEFWDDTYAWVNFAGTYRGTGPAGMAVNDFAASAAAAAAGGSAGGPVLVPVPGETGNPATQPSFQAQITGFFPVDKLPLVPGSITISMSGTLLPQVTGVFTDDGNKGLSGKFGIVPNVATFNAAGQVDYNNGGWSLTLDPPTFNQVMNVTYTYSYTVSPTNVTVTTPQPGSSGVTIYGFTVVQTGNRITLIDNYGAEYSGTLSIVETAGGDGSGNTSGEVIAQFEVKGRSAAGLLVTITGSFQGNYTAPQASGSTSGQASAGGATLSQRVLVGVWREYAGLTGDVQAEAQAVAVPVTGTDTGTTTVFIF